MNSISNEDRRSCDNSTINFNSGICQSRSPNNSNKKLYQVKIHTNTNTNTALRDISFTSNASNMNQNSKIMRVIRGGGGKTFDETNNIFFFNKMLNHDTGDKNKFYSKKINLDTILKEKKEQEIKFFDNDDLNNSKESENIVADLEQNKKMPTPRNDKRGVLNFFSKLIK